MVAYYNLAKTKPSYKRTITKRSYKNFTAERWNSCLENQDWSAVENCQNVEEMVWERNRNDKSTVKLSYFLKIIYKIATFWANYLP